MARKPYLPDDDAGILAVLTSLDTNLPGALATKYEVDAGQLFRLKQGRLVFGWFVAANPVARQWTESLTGDRDRMFDGPAGPAEAVPGLPVLPAVPTITSGGSTVPVQLEPGFFEFLGRLVQQIKGHDDYDPGDGALLGIVGAVIEPPDSQIVPELKLKLGPSGRPVTMVKKTPFQGYTVWVTRGSAAPVEVGFSSAREYEIALPLPAAGVAEVWTVQVQYRYKNEPFGQRSQPVQITVRGL